MCAEKKSLEVVYVCEDETSVVFVFVWCFVCVCVFGTCTVVLSELNDSRPRVPILKWGEVCMLKL